METSLRIIAFDWEGAKHAPLYATWLTAARAEFHAVDDMACDWQPPDDTDLLVTAQTYTSNHVAILRRAMERGVPVLTLADGILEFRNTWRYPVNTPGLMFMPVIGHKMACIGRAQAAKIASWGNPGICEVVGIPSMDKVLSNSLAQPRKTFRLLVATATTPWFDEFQREAVMRSLRDMRDALSMRQDIEVWWRISPAAADELGVQNHVTRFSEMPMEECINHVDAVVSTPSTLMLYPMIRQIPVVSLDYTAVPNYLQTAWYIGSQEMIPSVLNELTCPPADKIWFQSQVLDDNLEWRGSSVSRLVKLIQFMAREGRNAREENRSPTFPERILPISPLNGGRLYGTEMDAFFHWSVPPNIESLKDRSEINKWRHWGEVQAKKMADGSSLIEKMRTNIEELDTRLAALTKSLCDTQTSLESRVSEVESLKTNNVELIVQRDGLVRCLHDAETHLKDTQTQLHGTEARLHDAETHLKDTQTQLHGTEARLHDAETHLKDTQTQLHGTEARLHDAETHLKDTQTQLYCIEARLNDTEIRLNNTINRLAEFEWKLTEAKDRFKRLSSDRFVFIYRQIRKFFKIWPY